MMRDYMLVGACEKEDNKSGGESNDCPTIDRRSHTYSDTTRSDDDRWLFPAVLVVLFISNVVFFFPLARASSCTRLFRSVRFLFGRLTL